MGARTITVNPTTPSNTLSFQVPAYFNLDVQAVFANIDASGAGDTTGLLEVADGSGAVIARKAQGQVISGGTNPGSATWALRLGDEQAAAPVSGGDYVFVAEHKLTGAGSHMVFNAIPQDGRHLVLFIMARWANSVPSITLNGDNGANYRALYKTLQDFNGAVTDVNTSLVGQTVIPLAGMDGEYPSRAVVTIPYYRLRQFGDVGRTVEIESWTQTEDIVSNISLVRHTEEIGFWSPPGPPVDPAITSIDILYPGAIAASSLYKIM